MNELDSAFYGALSNLLGEILNGPEGEAYILNRGDIGLLRQLESIPAAAASTPAGPGRSTIAAHMRHVLYGFSLINRWAAGDANAWAAADWNDAWRQTSISEDEWRTLKQDLRRETESWRKHLDSRQEWDIESASGALSSLAHTAYHLGAIRQMLAAT
jgi:hypothetical protein